MRCIGRRSCFRGNWSANWKTSTRVSNISWCRHYVRWWDRPTTSRERPIILNARSRALTAGSPGTACRKGGFPTRCARTRIEPRSGGVTLHCKNHCFPASGFDSLAAVRCHTGDPCTGYGVRLFGQPGLERFRAKWIPVRVKKTRQNKNLEPRSDSIGTEKALGCGRQEIVRQNLPEGSHGNVDASVLATLHHSHDLQRRHGIASRYRDRRSQGARSGCDPDRHFRRPHATRHSRSHAKEPRGSAQLSDLGALTLSAGRDPARDAAILLREREGRHAVQSRYPRRYLPACEDGARQAAVRHPGGCLSRGL